MSRRDGIASSARPLRAVRQPSGVVHELTDALSTEALRAADSSESDAPALASKIAARSSARA